LPNATAEPPQGSAISTVLANLFMHYAFDRWMAREFPAVPFERYADDAVVHFVSEGQAQYVRQAIADRMAEVGLRLHLCKTKIVYCKDGKRKFRYEHTSVTFLGFTFRARAARSKHGVNFTSFMPAISKDALKRISGEVRRWRLHRQIGLDFREVAKRINPIVRGWMQYYGAFYHSALCPLLLRINAYLMRWIRKKYKRLRPFTVRRSWRTYPDDQRIARTSPETKFLVIMFDDPASVVGEMLQILGRSTIRGYLRRQFFKDHLIRYSKSRRKAPLLAANGFLK
jgi:RNA-directed DNA polymerase